MNSLPVHPSTAAAAETRRGVLAALLSNLFWGFLPLLFYFVDAINPLEVVAARTLCSLLIVGVAIVASGRTADVRKALASRRTTLALLMSALFLAANWVIYVTAVQNGHVLEGSFGYFITPIVNVAMGMVLLGERQTFGQMAALGLVAVAIAIQAVGLGTIPYISLGLAVTFGIYGFIRKTVAANAGTGLFVETALLSPIAAAYLVYAVITGGPGPLGDPRLAILLLLTGPATAIPLTLFAYSAQRLRLTTIGMFQYLSPSVQFVLAITFFGEHLSPLRLVSFVLVWVGLLLFSADSFRQRATRPVAPV